MKKFLSVLLAVTMVFSLMVGFRAPTAKAATALTTSPDIAAGVTFPQGTATTVTATVTDVPVCADAYFKVTISGVALGAVTITGFNETSAGVFEQAPHLGTIPAQSSLSQALTITFSNSVTAGNYFMTVAFYDGINLIASENGVAIVQAPTPPVTTLSAPTITSIVQTHYPSVPGDVYLTVNFTSVTGATSYNYVVSNVPFGSTITAIGNPGTIIRNGSTTNTYFVIDHAKYGLTYYVAVQAVNGSDTSSWATSSFTPTCTVVTMGQSVTGTLPFSNASGTTVNLHDAYGSIIDSQYLPPGQTSYTLNSYLASKEGLGYVEAGGTFVNDVYIKYIFSYPSTSKSPLSVGDMYVVFSGRFTLASGSYPFDSGSHYVDAFLIGPDNKIWAESTAKGYLTSTFTNGSYPLIPGDYKLVVIDGYSNLASDPDSAYSTNWNHDIQNNSYLVYPSSYSVYYTWTVTQVSTAYQLTITHVLDPEVIYAGQTGYAYLYITDSQGNPVTGIASGAFKLVSGVTGFSTFKEIGNGFYEVSGTPVSAGTANYSINSPIGSGFYVGQFTLNFVPQDSMWNPTIQLTKAGTGIDNEWNITVNYNVAPSYVLHDQLTNLSGPLGEGDFATLGGTDASGFANVDLTVQTGGQIGLELNAMVWTKVFDSNGNDITSALNAKATALKKTFKINPTITGDLVTVSTDSVNVGDTADVTVTVMQPSGVERNNGRVVLSTTVPGMFTIPTGALYSVDILGENVTMDASQPYPNNVNIVHGQYVFTGLKFNHKGYIDVYVYDGAGNLSAHFVEYIAVKPTVHTLTSDTAEFVAGQVYPVVYISGGIAGLSFTEYDAATGAYDIIPSYIDNGDGSYIFNFAAGIPAWTSSGIILRADNLDDRYTITIPVVKPTITITSVHTDGLITDSMRELFTFKVTDPLTGAVMIPSTSYFGAQYNYWDVTGNPNLQVSEILESTVKALGETNSLYVKATTGNPYVDYTVDKPNIKLYVVLNGQTVSYSNELTVAPAQITVSPKDLVLYYNQNNMFSVKSLDAHGQAIEGVHVYGTNPYQTQVGAPYQFGGITGPDGVVAFSYTPNYIGELYVVSPDLGITVDNGNAYVVQIVPAPADTTAPTLIVTAPADKSTVNTPTVKVTGKATDDVGVTVVAVNDVPVTLLPDGSFATTVTLAEGDNTIVVKAFDAAGNVATQTLTVTYQKPAPTGTKIVLRIGSDVMTVNGKVVQLDAAPEINNGRTFLPLRAIAEAFGAQVTWVPETQGITVVLGDNQIGLQIGNNTAVVNGNVLSIVPPYIKNGRTMVPLRVIAEGFGAQVEWDPVNYIVTITMP